MASACVPGIRGWGNLYYPSLPGACRLTLHHAEGLQALFLFGLGWSKARAPPLIIVYKVRKSQYREGKE